MHSDLTPRLLDHVNQTVSRELGREGKAVAPPPGRCEP